MRSQRLLALAAAGVLVASAPAPHAKAARYDDYHRFAEVEQRLQAWSQGRPELKILTLGQSAGGRPLYVAQIAAPGGARPEDRPAVFVGANAAGFHNAGTEAALDLIERLLSKDATAAGLLRTHTFYVAPALNPDAHDGLFSTPRARRGGNGQKLDRDRDGLEAEDSADDLNGDGVITRMRIADAAGAWLPHPSEPRLHVQADAMKERAGAWRLEREGRDDDRDGKYNEDGADGVWVNRNFPHAFPHAQAEAGPWSSFAPESKAAMDFLLARRNIALAVIYGPANNLLAMPQSLGGGNADIGTQKFKLPPEPAEFLGFDPNLEYTLDEIWEQGQHHPFVQQNQITKEQLGQFLGAGPATKVDPDDMAYLEKAAEGYKERLKKAGLSDDRPAEQYGKGGLTPWLYYQAGTLALELDVWGIPKAAKKEEAKEGARPALTLDSLASMTTEQFLAIPKEEIAAFLKENKVPAQFGADQVIAAVKGGQIDPKGIAERARQMGAGGGGGEAGGAKKDDGDAEREREILAWVDEHAPDAFTPWKPATLPDGTRVEIGGLDPFIETAPPMAILKPALAVHTDTVLDLAGRTARVEVLSLDVEELGGGVWRVRAVAGNRGWLPTHTKLAQRAQAHLPVRLVLKTGDGVELVTGRPTVAAERLEGVKGTVEGVWLVKAGRGAKIEVEVITDNAGRDRRSATAGKGA